MIAGRRIRLWSEEGVTIRPDERFSSFIVAGGPPSGLKQATADQPSGPKQAAGDPPSGLKQAAGDPPSGLKQATGDPPSGEEHTTGITPDRAAGPGEAGLEKPADLVIQGRKVIPDETVTEKEGVFKGINDVHDEAGPELTVKIIPGTITIPGEAVRVFDAQLMEEGPAGPQETGQPFWEIFRRGAETYASVYVKEPSCNPVLVMPDAGNNWKIFADAGGSNEVNPLPYPVDGLLLYFLSSARGDIMIHGSGVICSDHGWIFTGRSGSGKTTLARIFDAAGDRVIHDDRLILRKEDGGWTMHSTPVYRNDEPRSAGVDHLWAISHGNANVSEPVGGAEAAAMLLSNCIQQNWDGQAAARLAASVDELVKDVPVSRLTFMPDKRIRDYLTARSADGAVISAGAASAILGEDRAVTITAGGYSMWPAIKPGDKVVIEPLQGRLPAEGDAIAIGPQQDMAQVTGDGIVIGPQQSSIPAAGDIVALRRDGGYVVHRVTEVSDREGRSYFRTQGDAVTKADEPADISTIAGIVTEIMRKGKKMVPSRKIFPAWVNRLTSLIIRVHAGIRR